MRAEEGRIGRFRGRCWRTRRGKSFKASFVYSLNMELIRSTLHSHRLLPFPKAPGNADNNRD